MATVLLTGGSGTLGKAIHDSKLFPSLLSPSKADLDITSKESVHKFISNHDILTIVHCAALARMGECEKNPMEAIKLNIQGTAHMVEETLRKEKKTGQHIRFIQISTDGVYPGTAGNYKETDAAIPYNLYGWTKLGGARLARKFWRKHPSHCR